MVQHEVFNILVSPLAEETGVTVLALGINPHVERFGHHHHTQRVVDLHLHRRRHVVARSNSVATHLLQNLHLAYERSFVDGSSQRAKVVVQTDALQLASLAVEFKPMFTADANGTNARFHRFRVYQHTMISFSSLAQLVHVRLYTI